MKQLPLYLRMWFSFLALRRKPFTELDMTNDELHELAAYMKGKYSENMYLSFGAIHMEGNIATDLYDFAKAAPTSLMNRLVNFSYEYQTKLGYKGYDVRIDLTNFI
jgi:hypothetical protein